MRRFSFSLLCSLAISALITQPLPSHAQTQALDFVSGATRYDFTGVGASSWVVGYEFKTAGDVAVYNLGFYDSGLTPRTNPGHGTLTLPDGFIASHAVGIYDADKGKLLVQAIVPQASTLLDSNFRYASDLLDATGNLLAGPYILPTSGTYIIAGVSNGENYTYVQNAHDDLTHDANVAYLHSGYQIGDALTIPNTQDAAIGYFGPNFTTSAFRLSGPPSAATPEPGAATLALCATVAGLLWRAQCLRRSPRS